MMDRDSLKQLILAWHHHDDSQDLDAILAHWLVVDPNSAGKPFRTMDSENLVWLFSACLEELLHRGARGLDDI